MAETYEEKLERITVELQQLLQEQIPDADFSVGTVLHELVVRGAAAVFAQQEDDIEAVRDNMSLVQVLNSTDPDPEMVDNLLSNFNTFRREGTRGIGLLNIFTTSEQNVYIPSDAIFTCGSVEMNPVKSFVGVSGEITDQDTESIAYVQMRQFDANTKVFAITAETVDNIDTVISPGISCQTNLGDSSIVRVEVASTFTGGSTEETTTDLLERAATGINAQVTTGRDNIRALLQENVDLNVLDVNVFGMGDDLQLRDTSNNGGISTGARVDVYVTTNTVPSTSTVTLLAERDSDGFWSAEIPNDTYPGAYGVTSITREDNVVNTDIDHILGYESPGTYPLIRSALHARYSAYQTLTVRFRDDSIPSSTTTADFDFDVLFMPNIGSTQEYLEDVDRRSYSFDTLVKATIPVIVDVNLDIEYARGIDPPSVEELQTSIADTINLKNMGDEALYSSDVVYAVKLLFPDGEVRMPVNMFARVFLPDGTQAYSTNQNYVKVMTEEGISPENSTFFCYSGNVDINLVEVLP